MLTKSIKNDILNLEAVKNAKTIKKDVNFMDILLWEEEIYSSVFDETFDSLMDEYDKGKLSIENLEINVKEHYQIMENSSSAGAGRFQFCAAMVDAHQYALSIVKTRRAEEIGEIIF